MPVILAEPKDWEIWLDGSLEEVLKLQAPLPGEGLQIVARNIRTDEEPVQTSLAV